MKRTLIGGLLAAALAVTSFAPRAADVTITVNGKVVAKPCTVSTVNATVELGDLLYLQPDRCGIIIGMAYRRSRSQQLPGGHLAGDR
ncbi:P pilus assembly protein, pilin FimA [Kluyvera cryocrescens]|uniref:P pilus assembly protein, pilin FimA n=1 Tax=Kluyvera cryocrescens TaxID=580 RepID=A0A485CPJ7_KLUCR|nr:P pilus assembly protein, pilin FimA [Kluyvera cryocrescens]